MKKVAILAILCAAVLTSCGVANPVSPSTPSTPPPTVTVTGTVISQATGQAVADATISIGAKSARSDSSGAYSLEVGSLSGGAQAKVACEGFVSCQKPLAAASEGRVRLDAALLPRTQAVVIDPKEANVVTSPEGATVELPVFDSIDEPLAVSVTYIDAGSSAITSAPGDFSGIGSDGADACLISRGMIDVKVKGVNSGNDYSLNGLGNYRVTVPIPSNLDTAAEGSTIPMWYFDEARGKWIEEGFATKTGSAYVGTVSHFTTWNMDFKAAQLAAVSGTIVDPVPESTLSCYTLTVSFPGYVSSCSYGDKGPFSVLRLPCATTMDIAIQNTVSGEIVRKSVTTPSTTGTLDAGEFVFKEQYYPAVSWLLAKQVEGGIRVSWKKPTFSSLDNVTISCQSPGMAAPLYQMITTGVETATFPLADEGYYSFTATAYYSGPHSSAAVSTVCKYVKNYDFHLSLDIDPAFPNLGVKVYLTPEGGTGRFLYSGGVLTYPAGYQLRIDLEETNLPSEYEYRFWDENLYAGILRSGWDEEEQLYFTTDGDDDYDIVLHYETYNPGAGGDQ